MNDMETATAVILSLRDSAADWYNDGHEEPAGELVELLRDLVRKHDIPIDLQNDLPSL